MGTAKRQIYCREQLTKVVSLQRSPSHFKSTHSVLLQGVYKPLYTIFSRFGLPIRLEIVPQPIRAILPLLFFWQISRRRVSCRKVFNSGKQMAEKLTNTPSSAFQRTEGKSSLVRTYHRPLLHPSRKPGASGAPESSGHYSGRFPSKDLPLSRQQRSTGVPVMQEGFPAYCPHQKMNGILPAISHVNQTLSSDGDSDNRSQQ